MSKSDIAFKENHLKIKAIAKKIQGKQMANIKVKYLIKKSSGYYWQPSTRLRQLGWESRKLADTLEAAIAEARRINEELEKWRLGKNEITQVPVINSMNGLIASYKKSKNYRKLRENTRSDYDYRLELIAKWAGEVPVDAITRKAVQNLWERLAKKSEYKANATIRILRLLLNYAIFMGDLQVNPAARPGLISIPPRDVVWETEEVFAAVEAADALGYFDMGTAILAAAFLAQRLADILKLNTRDYQNGCFLVRQNKTNAYIAVPVHPILKQRLEAYRNRPGLIIQSDITGGQYTRSAFNHRFRQIREEAAKKQPSIKRCKFLDLRRTAIVRLAEAGCTEAQISAVSGHKIDTCRRILETYLPRNAIMAQAAIEKYTAYLPLRTAA